jgi:hypothetical protein
VIRPAASLGPGMVCGHPPLCVISLCDFAAVRFRPAAGLAGIMGA